MIAVQYHRKFLKEFQKLPSEVQEKLIQLEEVFRQNPFHSQLHTKKLQGKLQHAYSFRIRRGYRVIFTFTAKAEVLFLAVKHRREIYREN